MADLMKTKKIEKYSYYINQILGKGSFGKVYKGKNDITGKIVAVKKIEKK